MKQNTRRPNPRASEPWTYWGLPKKVLADRSRAFHSASLLHVLMELKYGATREIHP